jgi:hypothetical protein
MQSANLLSPPQGCEQARPDCFDCMESLRVHEGLGVKRRGRQLVRKIDWHLDLGVSELETPRQYAHAQWHPVQGLCRSAASHALPATPFLAGHVPGAAALTATEATVQDLGSGISRPRI